MHHEHATWGESHLQSYRTLTFEFYASKAIFSLRSAHSSWK